MTEDDERELRELRLLMFHMKGASRPFVQNVREDIKTKNKQMILGNVVRYAFDQLGNVSTQVKSKDPNLPDALEAESLKKDVAKLFDLPL